MLNVRQVVLCLAITVIISGCNNLNRHKIETSSLKNCEPELNGDGSIRRMICR